LHFYKLFFGAVLSQIIPVSVGSLLYSVALGFLYQKTKSLAGPVIAHNIGNTLMLLGRYGMT